jgi:hypothetical protein
MLRNQKPSPELAATNQYASIRFTQGPRQKSKATIADENLVKDMLYAYRDKCELKINYNTINELVITVNGHFYNLAQLLKHQPDFEQLIFSPDDLKIYEQFLRSPQTAFGHIEKSLYMTEEKLQEIERAFPGLTRAELSPIRSYTIQLYAAMNFLTKFNATKIFPRQEEVSNSTDYVYDNEDIDLKAALSDFADKLHPTNYSYDPSDPALLAPAVRELVLATGIASSALSKPLQDELHVAVAVSHEALQDNFKRITGNTLIFIPRGKKFDIVIVAYGRLINQTSIVDVHALLAMHHTMQHDGIVLTSEEFIELTAQLNTTEKWNSLEDLSSIAKIKLIDIVTAEKAVKDLFYEPLIRFDEDVAYFKTHYLPAIYDTINTRYCFHFYSAFYSSSFGSDPAMHHGLNIQTRLINPITWGRNIQLVSLFDQEEERLYIPNQQFGFTSVTSPLNENNRTVIYIDGFPIRSIDGLEDNYSHAAMLEREKSIRETAGVKQPITISEKNVQLQTSSATLTATPVLTSTISWLVSAIKPANTFLQKTLIEQPLSKLGNLADYYFNAICQLITECETYFPAHNRNLWSHASNENRLFHSAIHYNYGNTTAAVFGVSSVASLGY